MLTEALRSRPAVIGSAKRAGVHPAYEVLRAVVMRRGKERYTYARRDGLSATPVRHGLQRVAQYVFFFPRYKMLS